MFKLIKKSLLLLATACGFFSAISCSGVSLQKGDIAIYLSNNETDPVKLAANTLVRDFESTMGFKPVITDQLTDDVKIVIISDDLKNELPENVSMKELGGFESHRVWAGNDGRIYLSGKDMRGTIYAIYTFSEEVLGVPPLWFWSSFQPEKVEKINIKQDLDIKFDSPDVRYRAWFPNDTDFFTQWRRFSQDNNEMWLETMLRLKLNTVELEATVAYPDYKLNREAGLLKKYGLVLTSHHHVACNNNLVNWPGYWEKVKGVEPPALLLSNEDKLIEFWRYSIETVCRNEQENLWQIAFRGVSDQPFWAAFADAPEDDKTRAEIINKMMRIQLEMIKEISGEEDPFVRMTFYDELSDLLAKGYLDPPTGKNMLWTFVAGRRDHYPYDDLVNFEFKEEVSLGYYMNLQFTSTGSHLVAAEGPWKMEDNYRYVNSKNPLQFSVVNAGNIREHVMEMSANADMMWDMDAYDTDKFLLDFCAEYFGKKNAEKVADLYVDYYDAWWNQRPSEFPGMERQFIFHDMRYGRVFDQILKRYKDFSPNPLHDIGFERVKGRSFRLTGDNQVDTLIKATQETALRFEKVAEDCEKMYEKLPVGSATFFRDNLLVPAQLMERLNVSLHYFLIAYKNQDTDTELKKSLDALIEAKALLYSNQENVFTDWYKGERLWGFDRKINNIRKLLEE